MPGYAVGMGSMYGESLFSREPYRRRTWIRMRLPWWMIRLGIADKGEDCEKAGSYNVWFSNQRDATDPEESRCIHCHVVKPGRLWELPDAR